MCADPGTAWVGDYDAGDLIGECPTCRSGVGVFAVEHDFPRRGNRWSRRVEAVIATRGWDTLDGEASRWFDRQSA